MTTESKMMIGLLNGIMPPSTPLTVQTEIQVLELIGVVKDPELVKKMKLLTSIAPPGTPATLPRRWRNRAARICGCARHARARTGTILRCS